MFKGQLPVMNKDAGRIGALLAQAEIGDLSGQAGQLCYPKFFKDWNPGVAREISRHHAILKGKSTTYLISLACINLAILATNVITTNNKIYISFRHIRYC